MPEIQRDTKPDTLINLHLSIGVLILFVAVIRLAWRATHAEPPPEDGVPPWQTQSARIVHWLLYALLFVLPILGWINASWRGFPVIMFGLELPKLVATRAPGWGWTGDVHSCSPNMRCSRWSVCTWRPRSTIISSAATACCNGCCRARDPSTRSAAPRSDRDARLCAPDSSRRKSRPRRKTGTRRRSPRPRSAPPSRQ